MSSTYQLRSITAGKQETPQGLLSPTFVTKFKSLATSEKQKGSLTTSPSLTGRKRAASKRILKKTDATIAVPDMTTPTKKFHQTSPRTAPSKMQTEDSPFLAPSAPTDQAQDFKIWEDPDIGQSDEDSLVPIRASLESNTEQKKENSPPPDYNQETVARQEPNSTSINRSVLGQVKVSAMEEYKKLIGESFKIISSPTSVFYANSTYKFPFQKLQYSKDLPHPSASTRTAGSAHYRATTVNLFRTKPGSNGIVLNHESPTTPRRVPDFIHPSRVTKRLFKAATPGSGSGDEKTPKRRASYLLRPRPVTKNGKEGIIPASVNIPSDPTGGSASKKSKRDQKC